MNEQRFAVFDGHWERYPREFANLRKFVAGQGGRVLNHR